MISKVETVSTFCEEMLDICMKHYFNEHFYYNFNDFDENELRSIASQVLFRPTSADQANVLVGSIASTFSVSPPPPGRKSPAGTHQ